MAVAMKSLRPVPLHTTPLISTSTLPQHWNPRINFDAVTNIASKGEEFVRLGFVLGLAKTLGKGEGGAGAFNG